MRVEQTAPGEATIVCCRSRLGQLCRAATHEDILKLCDGYSLQDNQFFFDRSVRVS